MSHAVVLTALTLEYQAVRSHLTDIQEAVHPQGTVYERGKFAANGQSWDVGIAEVGAGNANTALESERAIAYFKPEVILFVGVAGGIKDVVLGDVVASTKIYGYESGEAEKTFEPRPVLGWSAYELEQRAKAEARRQDWLQRLVSIPSPSPKVYIAPIAAGEKVVASIKSEVFKFLRSNYGDAIAVEMEGFGFLDAARANQQVLALVIRGISDLIYNKTKADKKGYQEIAAHHASAFAFEVLAKFFSNRKNALEDSTQGVNDGIENASKNPNLGKKIDPARKLILDYAARKQSLQKIVEILSSDRGTEQLQRIAKEACDQALIEENQVYLQAFNLTRPETRISFYGDVYLYLKGWLISSIEADEAMPEENIETSIPEIQFYINAINFIKTNRVEWLFLNDRASEEIVREYLQDLVDRLSKQK